MPFQVKVRYGKTVTLFQASLIVMNQSMPLLRRICGRLPL